jgi:hypothetical protein
MTKQQCVAGWLMLAILALGPRAKGIETVVIGLTSGGAPAFEESFDKQLREDLANFQELYTADSNRELSQKNQV